MTKFTKRCPYGNIDLVFMAGTKEEANAARDKKLFIEMPEDCSGCQQGSLIFIDTTDCDTLPLFLSVVAHEATHWAINISETLFGKFDYHDKAAQERLAQVVEWIVLTAMIKCGTLYDKTDK